MLQLEKVPAAVQAKLRNKFTKPGHATSTYFPPKGSKTNELICSTNDWEVDYKKKKAYKIPQRQAEKGKYVITYHVKDKAKNSECTLADDSWRTNQRTVIVKDVIANVKVIKPFSWNTFQGSKTVKKFETGPKYKDVHSGAKYMAEESENKSVNAWIVGAVASAVTGLALLSYSQRKTVTTVPV